MDRLTLNARVGKQYPKACENKDGDKLCDPIEGAFSNYQECRICKVAVV